jgi:hypothetical protein
MKTARIRRCAFATFAALAGFVAVAAPSNAKTTYDGNWSVLIVTEKGDCDRAYRYPVAISDGKLANAGSTPIDISGQVAGDGKINVRVSYGSKNALGIGRLSGTSGTGSWNGGSCAGTWTAERR